MIQIAEKSSPYLIGRKISGFGVIKAVKGGQPRDYLLVDAEGTATWLDELAIDAILAASGSRTNNNELLGKE